MTSLIMTSMRAGDLSASREVGAKSRPAEAEDSGLRKVAQQFEALFVKQMLAQVDVASGLGGEENSQSDFVNSMWRDQLSTQMTQGAGLGLADMLMRQLGGGADLKTSGTGLQRGNQTVQPLIDTGAPAPAQLYNLYSGEPQNFANPQDFVSQLRPHLERAAQELGVSPKLLMAQAAVETGWGKHMPRDEQGQLSKNLFGIKADASWSGAASNSMTHEFVEGQMESQRDNFRSYGSYAQSVQDYVAFLKRNPRYEQALEHGGSDKNFLQGLKSAGYATDPHYVDKITDVAQGPTLERYWNAL
jgi:flagellar protein FlgJ